MKKLFPGLVVLALVAGLSQTARAETGAKKSEEMLTAIDVTRLLEKGESSAMIANTLARQWGMDRSSPPLKEKSDEQVISYLLATTKTSKKVFDKGKFITYKAEGETYLKNLLYDKAAKKFSLAMIYSEPTHDLYKLRGDSYRLYLTTKFSPASVNAQNEVNQVIFENNRKLLCKSIHSDYLEASKLVEKSIQDGVFEMNKLRNRMVELKEGNDPNVQYKKKSAENIIGMRLMQRTRYKYNAEKHADISIRKALADYKVFCAAEDAERRNLIKRERDKSRDKKWLLFAEKDDGNHYYDKTALAKGKTGTTVVLRKENSDDETSYNLTKVTLDCTKKTVGIQESSSFGEDGTISASTKYKQIIFKDIVPGSAEDLLRGKICN
ncbi:hypothetical protein FDZ73_07825 [bacterium]|nr:MAG: hypothetical protein FDZ73_07825 [bacterium]